MARSSCKERCSAPNLANRSLGLSDFGSALTLTVILSPLSQRNHRSYKNEGRAMEKYYTVFYVCYFSERQHYEENVTTIEE